MNNVPAALASYRDRLGFDITFQGPAPEDIFSGIVQRGAAMIMFKHSGVELPLWPSWKPDEIIDTLDTWGWAGIYTVT